MRPILFSTYEALILARFWLDGFGYSVLCIVFKKGEMRQKLLTAGGVLGPFLKNKFLALEGVVFVSRHPGGGSIERCFDFPENPPIGTLGLLFLIRPQLQRFWPEGFDKGIHR